LVFAGLIPKLFGKKIVLDIHDSMPETFAAKFSRARAAQQVLRLEERVSASIAQKIVCVNEPQRIALVKRGIAQDKTLVSMNVPDPALFPARPIAEVNRRTLNLVYHGTMAERLGVDLIIRAVSVLRHKVPYVQLHLWGRGDDLASFQQLAQELSIEGAIDFRPQGFALDALAEQLAGMDIGVVGNRRSPAGELMLPVKLLEYMAVGIPAVVPRLNAIEHYFTDDMVTFYEPDDVDGLAAAISALHGDAQQRRVQVLNAQRFLCLHGWKHHSERLITMYGDLSES
jgi:glycosyltransferase involved in cell wall biosynthesis